MSNDQILKELVKINTEMNEKYNSYDHLDKFKCLENEELLNLEKKFDPFSLDINYNYAINIINSKNSLPDINLDLSKIISYYKNSKINSEDELIKEIASFNNYFGTLSKKVTLNKLETIKEKSIVYYLFYFMSRAFFYIIMNNNFIGNKENSKIFFEFFTNYKKIIETAKVYIKEDVSNSSIIIDEKSKDNKKKYKIQKHIYEAFVQIRKYPNEFKEAILNCQNFLIVITFSYEKIINPNILEPPLTVLDKDMGALMEIFIENMDLLYKVNKQYSIIDYKNFYNDGICKNIIIKDEFLKFLRNEKIKKKIKKKKEEEKKKNIKEDDKEKNKEKEKEKEKEEDNEIDIDDDEESQDITEKSKIKFTLLDYMWLFNPAAKNEIIILFNNRQKKNELMKSIHQARDLRPLPFLGGLFISAKDVFLTINIRRNNLIEDTLNEISRSDIKLQNPIKVKFIGEQGVDEGGVRKEFFLLFIRQIFDPDYGMFNYNKKTRLYWFNHYTFEINLKYELIGVIFGLAIYNNIILDVKLPITVYKKLLGIKPDLEDMKECDPELYSTLSFLINSKEKI